MSADKRFTNKEIAEKLRLIGEILQIKGENRFRVLAFINAAESIAGWGQDLYSLHAAGKLDSIPGVGKAIAGDIAQLLETGEIPFLQELLAEVPLGVVEMTRVPGVGPKKAARLWQELGITSVEALKAAAAARQLRGLKGFGAKSEEKILQGIAMWEEQRHARMPLGKARPMALNLVAQLQAAVPAAISRIEVAGSVRRWQETVGDLDILCVSEEPQAVMSAFRSLPQVVDVVVGGPTKTRVRLTNGLECDLRVVAAPHWGAALQYFTGSKAHNVALRELALEQGWSLSEYGLKSTSDETVMRFFAEEQALYAFLGLDWIPPELRQNRGEIAAAQAHALPELIREEDIRGELHGHSDFSDGRATIAEMAAAAQARGYEYWLVSDHSVGLGITGGVDAVRLHEQRRIIDRLNESWQREGVGFRLLLGTEVEILADGSLGLPDEVLAGLDVVIASIHSSLRQDRQVITERCLRAVRNPHVDILGHPTGRLLGSRPESAIDMEAVLQACAATGTVLEINAHPARLDLNDVYTRRAVELGCRIAISTDAHEPAEMDLLSYGIHSGRRAWLRAQDVINTRPVDEMLAMLKK